jgi:hypothetical protein
MKDKLYVINHRRALESLVLLSEILWLTKGYHHIERQSLLEQILATNVGMSKRDGDGVAIRNHNLSEFHIFRVESLPPGDARTNELNITELYHREEMRINPTVCCETNRLEHNIIHITGPDSLSNAVQDVIQDIKDKWNTRDDLDA